MYLKVPILSDNNEIQVYSAVVTAVHEAHTKFGLLYTLV